MLIQHANLINRIRDADKFGIDATVNGTHFGEFVREVNDELGDVASAKEDNKRDEENLTLLQEEARFIDDYTVELTETGKSHTAERVVIAAGARL